jgi:ribosomal protein S18 acetylase RimI-like enzyme
MTEEDIPAALHLWQESEGIGLREADSPPALARYLVRNPGCSFAVVNEADTLLGVALAGHDGRRGYLNHVVVAEAHRGHGLARKLVEACLAALKREGIHKVHLCVLASNADGQKFWEHLGWRERTDLRFLSLVTGSHPNA